MPPFVCSSVHVFVCLGVLEFYNLVNGPVDNIVVKSSHVPGERQKKKEDRIDERKSTTSPPIPHLLQAQQVLVLL